jgi:hypothetical protein
LWSYTIASILQVGKLGLAPYLAAVAELADDASLFMMCLADCAPARIRILPAVAIGLICEAMRAFPAQNLSIGDNGAALRPRLSPLFAAAGLALALLLAATAALWAHYGTAVFYETMAAALAACL